MRRRTAQGPFATDNGMCQGTHVTTTNPDAVKTERPAGIETARKRHSPLREARLETTRAALLASALDHFAKRGFAGASLREIAADAGVQHGMIRHVYRTKEELWRQVIAFLFERMEQEMPEDIATAQPDGRRESAERWIRWYVGYCARHPEHARLMVQQSILDGPELEWASDRYIRGRHAWHRPFVEALQKAGHLPQVDPLSLFMMMTAAAQMPYLLAPEIKAVAGRDPHDPKEIAAHAEAVIRAFLR